MECCCNESFKQGTGSRSSNFQDSIQEVNWDEFLAGKNLDEVCSKFANKIQQIIIQLTQTLKLKDRKKMSFLG